MEQQFDTTKIGMWLFLVTEVLLFGGLFVGFGMMQARYRREFVEAHQHLQRKLGRPEHHRAAVFQLTMVMAVHSPSADKQARRASMFLRSRSCAPASSWASSTLSIRTRFDDGLLPGKFYQSSRAT